MNLVVHFRKAVLLTAFFFLFTGELWSQIDRLGLWVIRDQLTSAEKIDSVVEFAQKNGFTDLFVQVRGRDDAFYNSRKIRKSRLITQSDFDPLKYVLDQVKGKKIKVHAWVNVYLVWTSRKLPDKSHVIMKSPEWCAVDKDCNVADAVKRLDYLRKKREGIYLSPLVPEVTEYLFLVMKELIDNYSIDGLHFDYIRYANGNYDYNAIGRFRFKRMYGFDPLLFTLSSKDFLKGLDEDILDTLKVRWNEFLREGVTNFVFRVRRYVNTSGKGVLLSAAVKPDPFEAKNYYYQDWVKWLKLGYLDFVVPMNYVADMVKFKKNLSTIFQSTEGRGVWMGIGVYNQSGIDAGLKTRLVIEEGFSNIVYFSYKYLVDKRYILSFVREFKN